MVNSNPIELCTEIPGRLVHQLAGEAAEIRELRGIVRRDDEPEVMPVAFAALSKGPTIGLVSGRVEQLPGGTVARHTIALEIADMGSQRARRPHLPNDTRLDHRAAASRLQ
jgi:hypothetical protein